MVSILLILTITIGVFIFTNQENKTVEATSSLASGTASGINLDADGNLTNYFSSIITGAQNESIYFGDNFAVGTNGNEGDYAHTGAIKWRVLSVSDTKYSNGEMLLWADYCIGTQAYNPSHENPYYAFWGTSQMRATLNGGDYLSTVSNANTAPTLAYNATDNNRVDVSNSWYNQLFTVQERNNIVASKAYETKDWGYGTAAPYYKTTGITTTSSSGNGLYTSNVLNTTTGAAKFVTTSNSSVIETTSGDNLFLLDYYDINNTAYGFGDNGQVYANQVNTTWTTSSAFYPGYDDSASITSGYLKPRSDDYPRWWLRSVGRVSTSNSRALLVNASGSVGTSFVSNIRGVRPAFNFNPDDIIYATAANTSSIGNQFVSVGGTVSQPAYKVYLKSDDYKNYNQDVANAPIISNLGRDITVTSRNSSQTGSAAILLTDKDGNGEVAYQATANFVGGVATASIPSGINVNNYAVTVLFVDNARGGNYAETVTASYTKVVLESPTKVTTTYTGNKLTIADIDDAQKPWYDSALIDITYPTGYADGMTNVGTYTVKAEIKSAYRANTIFSGEPDTSKGENSYTRYFDYEITKKLLDYPTFFDGNSKPYDDGRDVLFMLVYDSNAIEIKHKGVAITGNQIEESAVNKYPLIVSLKDSDNYDWKTTPPSGFGFEITKKPIEVKLHDGNDGYNLTGMRGNKLK
ncbi:MAG: hypothetical protein K2L53_04915, partial [Clostridia bacterium]|nr:hypothetical protein [Clostridia bacterium]